jgi:hypothetical protein
MGKRTETRRGYRSLFWPMVLIAVGVIWLLGNIGILTAANLMVLVRLWPLLLIAIGLDLLIGRGSALTGTLIGAGTIALVFVLMLIGPAIGLAPDLNVEQSTYSADVDGAESAAITLNLAVGETTISALEDSSALIDAELNHVGDIDFRVEGDREKQVYLGQADTVSIDWPLAPFFPGNEDMQLWWRVGLNPDVPLSLDIDGGVGTATIDLSALEVTAVNINNGVGEVDLTLPASPTRYVADLDGGVGEFDITIAPDADVELVINGGVGGFTIDVPDNAAVRVEADTGLGSVRIPNDYRQISGDDEDGVWESDSYAASETKITIQFAGGIGDLVIR